MNHTYRFRPIYGDTDMMGVVYYANYLRFFEAGRTEFLRDAGFTYRRIESMGFAFPVVNVQVKYHSPAFYDDALELVSTVKKVSRSSLVIGSEITRPEDGAVIVTGEVVLACVDKTGKVQPLPEELRAVLAEQGIA